MTIKELNKTEQAEIVYRNIHKVIQAVCRENEEQGKLSSEKIKKASHLLKLIVCNKFTTDNITIKPEDFLEIQKFMKSPDGSEYFTLIYELTDNRLISFILPQKKILLVHNKKPQSEYNIEKDELREY